MTSNLDKFTSGASAKQSANANGSTNKASKSSTMSKMRNILKLCTLALTAQHTNTVDIPKLHDTPNEHGCFYHFKYKDAQKPDGTAAKVLDAYHVEFDLDDVDTSDLRRNPEMKFFVVNLLMELEFIIETESDFMTKDNYYKKMHRVESIAESAEDQEDYNLVLSLIKEKGFSEEDYHKNLSRDNLYTAMSFLVNMHSLVNDFNYHDYIDAKDMVDKKSRPEVKSKKELDSKIEYLNNTTNDVEQWVDKDSISRWFSTNRIKSINNGLDYSETPKTVKELDELNLFSVEIFRCNQQIGPLIRLATNLIDLRLRLEYKQNEDLDVLRNLKWIPGLEKLQLKLTLNSKEDINLPYEMGDMENLGSLSVNVDGSGDGFALIPNSVSGLQNLRHLELTRKTKYSNGFSKCSNLQEIDAHVPAELDENFNSLTNLVVASFMADTYLKTDISLPRLEVLRIPNARLKEMPDFSGCSRLEVLDLGSTQRRHLGGSEKRSVGNLLTSMEDVESKLPKNLQRLFIGNWIKKIIPLPSLTELKLLSIGIDYGYKVDKDSVMDWVKNQEIYIMIEQPETEHDMKNNGNWDQIYKYMLKNKRSKLNKNKDNFI